MKKRWLRIMNFIILAIMLASTVLLFLLIQDNKFMQTLVGILLSLLYVAWGIVYHSLEGDLHPKIVVEYLLVGAIAATLVLTIVWM